MNYNSGYIGYSMSVRASEAYDNGEMPLSKWTKSAIVSAISAIDESKAELLAKLPAKVLKEKALYNSSWHHTSNHFNRTEFYAIDEDFIEHVTEDDVSEILSAAKSTKAQAAPKVNRFVGDFDYIEWTGTRNHPKANKRRIENAVIEEKGCFYHVYDSNGNYLMKKKIGSNGTYVCNRREL